MVNDNDLDFEITPEGTGTRPSTKPPATNNNSRPTFPGTKPPSTTDAPYSDTTRPGNWEPTPSKPTSEDQVDTPVAPGYHRVVKGDTLYKLSRDYNTTVDRLKQINKLPTADIRLGQVLRIQ